MTSIHDTQTMHRAELSGQVKWYDTKKGFGFVVVSGWDKDFLLHNHVLQSSGRSGIAKGSYLRFQYESAANGLRVTEVINVDSPDDEFEPAFDFVPNNISEKPVPARVKWFDPGAGYGFVQVYGSNDDIFIGQSVLRQSILSEIQAGQAINIQTAENDGNKIVYRIHDWIEGMDV